MTYEEFRAALRATPRFWFLNGSAIRLTSETIGGGHQGWFQCPITAVYFASDYVKQVAPSEALGHWDRCAGTLNLDLELAGEIAAISDNLLAGLRSTPRHRQTRRELLADCGLTEVTP